MNKPTQSEPKPIAVSVTRAAALIGVSKWTIRQYARTGMLPIARLGRRMVVPMSALEKLVQDATVVSQ
jgi:excisionase family DNA binding protein